MNSFHSLLKRLRRLWTSSIRTRLILGIAITLSVASSAFIYDLANRQAAFLHQESREEAQALAQTLAISSVSWVLASDLAGLQEVIQAVQSYSDVRYAMILRRDGQVVAHTDARLVGRYGSDAVSATLPKATLSSQMLIDDADLIDVAHPIQANGAHIGWARVGLEQTRIRENQRALMRNSLIYALIAIALTVLLTIFLTRGLTLDLQRLVKAARRIGSGESGVKIDLGREDELGELGSALDNMTTQLDLASRSLRESEEKFRTLIEKSPLALIVTSGAEQRVELVNQKFTALFGYTLDDMPDVAHWWPLGYPDEKYREELKTEWFRRVEHANATEGEIEPMEAAVRCKDGATRHIEFRLASVGAKNLITFVDLTDRKLAEERQRAAALYARSLIEASLDALVTISAEGQITDVNKSTEEVTGVGRDELVNTDFADYFTEPEQARAGYKKVLADGFVRDYPLTIRHRSGHTTDVLYNATVYRNANGGLQGVFAAARDITERKQAERALRKVNGALTALSKCNEVLFHARDETALLQDICRVIADIEGYRLVWIGYAQHDESRSLKPVAQSGYENDYLKRSRLTWADTGTGRGSLGRAIRSGQIQVVQDVHNDPHFTDWLPDAKRLGYGSTFIAPLICDSEVIGALTINADGSNAFDAAEIALLSELAADTAFGISTLRTRSAHEHSAQRLQQSMETTIRAIADTVEARDAYTAGHQRRVAELATAIAREVGLSAEQVHGVQLAAIIHDLGKILIPAEILSRPGHLSPIEMKLIKTHPQAGYEILKDVDFPWPIAQVVYQHHERLDGSGYPHGLKNGEIILEAKIMMVADVVEAMASHRPYRPSLGIDSALQEIETHAGTLYDRDVARACLMLFREKGFSFSG